jgi:hypothetical protein
MTGVEIDIDPIEGLRGSYQSEPHDPFRHNFIAEGIREVFRLAEDFPLYFSELKAAEVCANHLEQTYQVFIQDEVHPDEERRWSHWLRARTLIALEHSCYDCKQCGLWKNTPHNMTQEPYMPVFGEGALDPLVMIVAEG